MRVNKKGTIINVSSTASFQPIPYMATYGATKAFVTSFSEAIAEENRAHGIRVLNLCPGATETNFFSAGKIKSPLKIKGMQTSEQVVDAALDALEAGKTTKISGMLNWVIAQVATIAPNSLVTKVIGNQLRSDGVAGKPPSLPFAEPKPEKQVEEEEKKTMSKGAGG